MEDPLLAENIFGERVRMARLERGWSQTDLANAMKPHGVLTNMSAVAKLENRTVKPPRAIRLAEAVALSQVLDIPLEAMVEDPRFSVANHIDSLNTRFEELAIAVEALTKEMLDSADTASHADDLTTGQRAVARMTAAMRDTARKASSLFTEASKELNGIAGIAED